MKAKQKGSLTRKEREKKTREKKTHNINQDMNYWKRDRGEKEKLKNENRQEILRLREVNPYVPALRNQKNSMRKKK